MTKKQTKSTNKASTKLILSTIGQFSKPYRSTIIWLIIGAIIATLVGSFAGPFIIARVIDAIQQGGITLAGSSALIGLFIITQIANVVIWRLNIYGIWNMQTYAQKDIYEASFDKIINHGLDFHADNFGGSLVSQTNKLIGAFERLWDSLIFNLIPLIVSIFSAIIILSLVFWQYAVVIAIVSVAFVAAVWFGSRSMASRNIAEAKASSRMSGHLADVVSNVLAVKSYATEKSEIITAKKVANDWVDRQFDIRNHLIKLSIGYSSIASMLRVAALISAIVASQHSLIPMGAVFLIMSYTMTVVESLWQTNHIMRNFNHVIGQSAEMVQILHQPISIVDKTKKNIRVKAGSITFKDVCFAHDGGEDALFEDFNLEIPAGQKVGLVGKSGSGKTSLTKLLLRFHDIGEGQILIDNQNIAKISQASLHQAIAYVPQEPLLFHRPIKENIAYAKPQASMKSIQKAASEASADDFIQQLPESYDTMVGERGVKLSGGQRQRVVIARAILKNAPILVLDEATSALDSDSEAKIQSAMDELMKNRTSIVIAHRLSTIAKLDRIIVLDNGKIIEDGTHRQLLAKKGEYAKLWRRQSGGFIQED